MSDWIVGNRALSQSEMEHNAKIVFSYFTTKGWTINAICGMLGNMQHESGICPTVWEGYNNSDSGGYGLVQWTPHTNFSEWAGSDWRTNHDKQLDRIIFELENGLQYYKTSDYPETFKQFSVSTENVGYLARAFLYNYERPADPNPETRAASALKWFEFFSAQPTTGCNIPIWLLFKIAKSNKKGLIF